MLVVIYPDIDIWNFVLQDLKEGSREIKFIPLNLYCSIGQRAIRQLLPDSALPPFMLLGKKLRKILSSLNYGDSVLLCDYANVNLLLTIKQILHPSVKVCLWFWNPILNKYASQQGICCAKNLSYEIYTFNPTDALEYEIKLLNQFFPMHLPKDENQIETDFYFQGFDKGRKNILLDLSQRLKPYKVCINIIDRVSDAIAYPEYIHNVKTTRCLIDIVQNGQKGITLRPLEALALDKKLLTNNPEIKNYDFYRKENILILGEDDIDSVDEFLSTPLAAIDNEIKMKYDTSAWIKNFQCNV